VVIQSDSVIGHQWQWYHCPLLGGKRYPRKGADAARLAGCCDSAIKEDVGGSEAGGRAPHLIRLDPIGLATRRPGFQRSQSPRRR